MFVNYRKKSDQVKITPNFVADNTKKNKRACIVKYFIVISNLLN